MRKYVPKDIDDYLNYLEDNFSVPILKEVRAIVHDTAPDIKESIKWGAPSFEFKGYMMSMMSFKEFTGVWFQKGALFKDDYKLLEASAETTKSLRKYIIPKGEQVNEEGLKSLVLEAVACQESGKKVETLGQRNKSFDRSELLQEALKENPRALEGYKSLSPFKQREFVEHIETAKQQSTKERRLVKALALLEQGIGLNDKYRKNK